MKHKKVISDLYNILESQLSNKLTYHSISHTKDVHRVCQFYIEHYNIKGVDKELLNIAAVGHDVGFTKVYVNHEDVSSSITAEIMESYRYSNSHVEIVQELIMSTRIPQNPGSFLAQILCDADLDYLGRDDFIKIGNRLKKEWINYDIVPNNAPDFNDIQIGFLKNHFYHTDYALEHREPKKRNSLQNLIQLTTVKKERQRDN